MIRAAAAGVRRRRVNIGVGGTRAFLRQRERAHDHPGLTVAALRRVEFLPRGLNRMAAVRREPFDRHDSFVGGHGGGELL